MVSQFEKASASDYEKAAIGGWYRSSCEDVLKEIRALQEALQPLLDHDDIAGQIKKIVDRVETIEDQIRHMIEYGPPRGPLEKSPPSEGFSLT
jgi:hypothetical protein